MTIGIEVQCFGEVSSKGGVGDFLGEAFSKECCGDAQPVGAGRI